ncbi:hypothetical protein HNP38_002776 [Chryseobacterium defluvii]|uniref:Uncharacterized protein n=1 Tax=Chryseobacterium defluvii TaxID=160396 RepID=A0A840KIZ2_9FLAO|nr:hypothetical protein [Chryseobacterium defluvii]MBB4807470.1 hypothetical protein [Chryseobacterium defluvii]
MSIPLHTILSYFQTGDFPTEAQFAASWSSFYHKDETIAMDKITGLQSALQNKTDKSVYEAHLTNETAHHTTLAKLDGSNLNDINIQAWKAILEVDDLPANIATVDDLNNNLYGNVWSKEQSDALYMSVDEFVQNGKIRADKIEALGLTEMITVTETSLSAFMINNANYSYEKNDIIAIPDGAGNHSLFIYKGGNKTTAGNYIVTGLTNITIAMVQGLQTALDGKIDKPTALGNYFINQNGTTSYRAINPTVNALLFWNTTDFTASDIFYNSGKYGIGTNTPSEVLHLNNGRIRAKAVVFDENTEVLPKQLTYDGTNRSYYGSDSVGVRRKLMYQTYEDYLALLSLLTDVQKDEIRIKNRKTGETYSIAQPRIDFISPPILENTNYTQGIVLRGLNLFLDTTSGTGSYAKLKHVSTGQEFPISNISVNQNDPTYMTFALNFNTMPLGKYRIIVYNHISGLQNIDTVELDLVSTLTHLPIPNLTWDKITGSGITVDASDYINSTGFYVNAPNQTFNGNSVALKSSELLTSGLLSTDFWLTISINQSYITTAYQGGYTLGLMPSTTPVNLTMGYDFGLSYNPGGSQNFIPTNASAGNITASINRLHIIKRANVITMIYNSNNGFKQTSFAYSNTIPLSLAFTLGSLIAPSSNNVDVLAKIDSIVQL